MAIRFKPRETIEIKPIDLQPKKALGVRLPFSKVGSPFILNYTTIDQVKSNLINVLLTSPGERFNEPLFGVGIYDQIFKQEVNSETLKERIRRQTDLFIPEVEILNLEISQTEHVVTIKVIYRLLANNAMDAITLTLN
jgi:phage baseplate assembly protein W